MKRITQEELANKAGVRQSTISRYLNGTREINLIDADAISKKTGLPILIFIDADLQKKYFGKSFRKNNNHSGQSRGGDNVAAN